MVGMPSYGPCMTRPAMLTAATVAALMTLASALAGCGAADHGSGPGASSPAPSIDAAHAGIPAGAVVGATTTPDDGPTVTDGSSSASPTSSVSTHRFGSWFHYGNGLWVKVDPPRPFTPSGWVKRQPGTPTLFPVQVRNNTGGVWNPSQLHVRLQSGLRPATQIFDYEKSVVARPEQRLADKGTVSFAVGYWVTDPSQLIVDFAPGFGYDSALVTSGR